jgi:hypothetical protein
LTAIVDRLLAKDPAARPTANELAVALRDLERSSGAETGALAPSQATRKLTTVMERPAGQPRNAPKRRRAPLLVAGLAAAVLLTLCAGVALASRWPEISAAFAAGGATPEAPAAAPAVSPTAQPPAAQTPTVAPTSAPTPQPARPTAVPAVAVPNVLGKRESEARRDLGALGLHVGPARPVPASQAPANLRNACVGCVVGIQPQAGASVARGSEVTLLVRAADPPRNRDDDD